MSTACDSAHVESVLVVAISSRSPDLSPSDFFLWGYVKGLVFVLPANIEEMKERITAALKTVTEDMCYIEFGTSSNIDSTCVELQAVLILKICHRTNKYLYQQKKM